MVKDYYSVLWVAFQGFFLKKGRMPIPAPSKTSYKAIGLQSFEYRFGLRIGSLPYKNHREAWAKPLKLSLAALLNSYGRLLCLPN